MLKRSLFLIVAALNAPMVFAADKTTTTTTTAPAASAPASSTAPSTDVDKLSYSLGVKTAEDIQGQNIQINPVQFSQGLSDKYSNKPTSMTDQQMQDSIDKFKEQHIQAMMEKEKQLAATNLTKSQAFLKQNQSKPTVKTTPSGLQYEILTPGKGASPKSGDEVTVNYRGTLLDGTEFDSTYKYNKPATLPVDKLITGWQEALKLMQPGAKWKVYVPPQLAYGEQGAGTVIEPNSTLIFEIELLDVKPSQS